jgi:hypothetical protein
LLNARLTRAAERRVVGRTGWPHTVMQIMNAGVLYFALVFGAGFVLGPMRVFWVAPHLGERTAELVEMPIMLGVMMVAARWIVRQLAVPSTWSSRLGMSGIALSLLLAAEWILVFWLRGLSIGAYVASRDPVSGTVYLLMLGVFALIPWLVARRGA